MREGEKAGWQRRESGVLLWPVQRCERTINSARWGLRTIRRCLNLEGAAGLCEVGGCACLVALYFQVQFCWLSSSSSSSSPLSMSMCKVWWNGIRWVTKSTRVPISIDPESAWMTGTVPRRRQPRLLSAYSLFSNRTSCFRQRSIRDRRVFHVSRIPLLSYPIISLISAFLSHLYGTLPHHFGAD